jgi:hypothetical protein
MARQCQDGSGSFNLGVDSRAERQYYPEAVAALPGNAASVLGKSEGGIYLPVRRRGRFQAGDNTPKEDGLAKLGTKLRPAIVRARTEERGMELLALSQRARDSGDQLESNPTSRKTQQLRAHPVAAGARDGPSTYLPRRLPPVWLGPEVREVLRWATGWRLTLSRVRARGTVPNG